MKAGELVIIGAGLAGTMAASAFRFAAPTVYTADEEFSSLSAKHKAIMRIRDMRVGLLLGCRTEQIRVSKAIYYGGLLTTAVTITMNNLYSLKTNGELRMCSISNIAEDERFLIEGDVRPDVCLYGYRLVGIESGVLLFSKGADEGLIKIAYDKCISTVPISVVSEFVGVSSDIFISLPIFVTRAKISTFCNLNQTIYVPEMKYSTYRASLQKQEIIIEGVSELSEEEFVEICFLFGVAETEILSKENYQQKFGKLACLDDTARKFAIQELTRKYNIYSLGRFATWRPLRVDQLLEDIEIIKTMIAVDEVSARYSAKKRGLI